MSDGFDRSLRRVLTKEEHVARVNLLEFRQRYYEMSEADRKRFKKDLHALVAAAKPFKELGMTVTLEFRSTWRDEDRSLTQEASRMPQEILKAIDEWDAADEKQSALEL